jgi:hypothetical protein
MSTEPADPQTVVRPERRWPMAVAVLAVVGIAFYLPESLQIGPGWIAPVLMLILLIMVIVADPGRIDRTTGWVHALTLVLVLLLIVTMLWATVALIHDLIVNSPVTASATKLLSTAALTLAGNIIAFGLFYWELDGGGPVERWRAAELESDFGWPQEHQSGLRWANWRPTFGDYLYLSYTDSFALSPTDVMPLRTWAKAAMTLESVISLAILGLVVARAVNVLT